MADSPGRFQCARIAGARKAARLDAEASAAEIGGVSGAKLKQEPPEPEPMQRKIFWITFMVLGLIADFALPIWWALGATVPIFCISWWVAYRSEWF